MAELLADIIHSPVPIILEKMVDWIHGSSLRHDELRGHCTAFKRGAGGFASNHAEQNDAARGTAGVRSHRKSCES
jgi:hypothetical protein